MITQVLFEVIFLNLTLHHSSIPMRSRIECGTRCVVKGGCSAFFYNVSDQACVLQHDPISGSDADVSSTELAAYGIKNGHGDDKVSASDLLNGNKVHNVPTAPSNVSTLTPKQRVTSRKLMLIRENMRYNEVWEKCKEEGGWLFQIDNKQKQEEAVKLAKKSGLEKIAIGAYRDGAMWRYSDRSEVTYADWEPSDTLPGIYGALSKTYDYRWIQISTGVNGGICEI